MNIVVILDSNLMIQDDRIIQTATAVAKTDRRTNQKH